MLRPTLVGEPPFWQSVSVFEYHIRVVGGLLGAFEVSGIGDLLHAASHAADRVLSVLPRKLGDAYTRTRQRLADPYGRPILWLVARIIDEVQARWPGLWRHMDVRVARGRRRSFGLAGSSASYRARLATSRTRLRPTAYSTSYTRVGAPTAAAT